MMQSKFSKSQILGILKGHQSGRSIPQTQCKRSNNLPMAFHGVSWGHGAQAVSGTGVRERQAQAIGRRPAARYSNFKGCNQKKVVTPEQKMECVRYAISRHKMSAARACKLMCLSLTVLYYRKLMPVKELIEENLGKGRLRRNPIILKIRRKHSEISATKIRRVYTNEGLLLYERMRKPRKKHPANPISIPMQANQWAMDFMSDALLNGRSFEHLQCDLPIQSPLPRHPH